MIDGEPGERTMEDAKAAAEAHFASWLDELAEDQRALERDLFAIAGGWKDKGGDARIRRDAQGRTFYRADEPGVGEIEIVATLDDFGDEFDAPARRWTVSGGTVSRYSDRLESLLQSEIIRHAARIRHDQFSSGCEANVGREQRGSAEK